MRKKVSGRKLYKILKKVKKFFSLSLSLLETDLVKVERSPQNPKIPSATH